MVAHSTLTGSNLHENKGAASATDNTVASATTGATVWRKVNAAMMDTGAGGVKNVNRVGLTTTITDVSTPGSYWVVSPIAGIITNIYSVLHTPITVADAHLTFEINGVLVTNGGITIAFTGAAAGDVDTSSPTANRTVAAGQAIEVITDGASTTASVVEVTIWLDVS